MDPGQSLDTKASPNEKVTWLRYCNRSQLIIVTESIKMETIAASLICSDSYMLMKNTRAQAANLDSC